MKAIQRIIYTGFAVVALASAAMPVFPAHTLPEARTPGSIDFAWHTDAGKREPAAAPQPLPPAFRR